MKSDVKEKWVAALRSGEFEQTQGILRSGENCYCSLGVLVELFRRETGLGYWQASRFWEKRGGPYSSCFLTPAVMDWAGLDDNQAALKPEGRDLVGAYSVDEINDRGRPFSEIADAIEAWL